ncbi:unnamed protein product [Brachionus calyciflorus]|uniref:Uncharacterized protein n=1 Tax=Brachionus calyciflorus TaxID=104777 RepID=A0A814T3J5_9BILA|nr:unnamed protein product [Brachionus calyciflorus]
MERDAIIGEDLFKRLNELKQNLEQEKHNNEKNKLEMIKRLEEENANLNSKKKFPLDKFCKSEGNNITGRINHQVITNCPFRKQELEQIEYMQRENKLLIGQLERIKTDQKQIKENGNTDETVMENLK